MSVIESRYKERLDNIPPPGSGCHPSLLGVANLGVLAGKDPREIYEDIRCSIPPGSREVGEREITDAIIKAVRDHQGGTFTPRSQPEPIIKDGKVALQRIIEQGRINKDVDLMEASPVRILCLPEESPVLFLSIMFEHDDFVFIGNRKERGILGKSIRTAAEWIAFFENGGKTEPHIIINPLDGVPRPKKSSDGETLRGDSNVKTFRHCLVEFDDMTREDQIRFWSVIKLPIVALIDSGGKSIHAWIQISKQAEIKTSDQWQGIIKNRLYDRLLAPLGVDMACSNPSRLSRLPGHYREEKQSIQRLLWLSPEGRPVC